MIRVASSTDSNVTPVFSKAAREKTRTALSPLTLRLTREERTRLEELAAGMTLSAYVRACVFAEDAKLRKTRPADQTEEKKAAAEAMAPPPRAALIYRQAKNAIAKGNCIGGQRHWVTSQCPPTAENPKSTIFCVHCTKCYHKWS